MNQLRKKIINVINSNNTKTVFIILLMVFIVVGYVFFFNSTKIFGENYDFEISDVGKIITLENHHTVKLTRTDIDLEQNVIEYEFYFENSNFDGYNDYQITLKTTTKTGKITLLKTETICADPDVYVVRATLPKKWIAVVADITLNKEDMKLEGKFYSDIDSLYQTKISGNTRDYFLQLDTDRSIERLQEEIVQLKQSNIDLENKISEIEQRIQALQERMSYMTADELREAERGINSMNMEKESALRQIDDNKKLISEYQTDIDSLEK